MQFLNPSAWLFAGLVAVLIALYLWERHRRQIDVPSLILWEAVPDAIFRTSQFRPDPLFFLQLLVLALLVAGFAGPYLATNDGQPTGTHHIFVLDASASMQAQEGRQSRFEEARGELHRRLAALTEDDDAMLIVAANRPHVAAAFATDRAALLTALADVQPVDTAANLNLALAMAHQAAARTDVPVRIEVFTDTPPSKLNPEWSERLGVFQVGETDDNLAIESLQIFQGRFQDYRQVHAYVTVRNFSHREAHGFLTMRLDDQILNRRGFSLTARGARSFPVGDLPGPGILRAALEVDDALALDNEAYGWIRAARALRVLVVSNPSPLHAELATISDAAANLQFRFLDPADYEPGVESGSDIVVYHRFVPDAAPEVASLYLFPSTGNGWFGVTGEASALEILDWNYSHPTLRAIRPEFPFPLRHVRLLELPASADRLLISRRDRRDIPLAFAGHRAGRRTAGIAFDLVADRLLAADHTNLLLFFLNLLDWLAPADESVTVLRTGVVRVISDLPANPRQVIDPHGRTSTFPADGPLTIEALYTGEYRIAANGTSRRVLANFLDPPESDIGRPMKTIVSSPPLRTMNQPPPGTESNVGLWLYAIAAALLCLEWLIAARGYQWTRRA